MDNANRLGACIIPAGSNGNLMSKVARKNNWADLFILLCKFTDAFSGTISGAVVYENKFPGFASGVHYFFDTAMKLRQVIFFIINWCNNRVSDFHFSFFF